MTTLDRPGSFASTEHPIRRNGPRFPEQARSQRNVGDAECMVSLALGAILTALGLSRRSIPGLLVSGVGGMLLYRGATGKCPMYENLGIDTAHEGVEPGDYFERGV